MSTAEEHDQIAAEGAAAPIEISIVELGMVIWQRRRWLAKVIGLGMLVTIGIALLIPNKYTSTAQLMPPDQQALSRPSMLSAFTGVTGSYRTQPGGGLDEREIASRNLYRYSG